MTKTHRQPVPEAPDEAGTGARASARTATQHRLRQRMNNWPVATKVLAVLAIPALIATLFAGIQVASQIVAAGRASAAASQADALTPAWEVLRAADNLAIKSSDEATSDLAGAVRGLKDVRDHASLTDAQRADVDRILAGANTIAETPGPGALPAVLKIGRALGAMAAGIEGDTAVTRRVADFRELVNARVELAKQRDATASPSPVVGVDRTELAASVGAEGIALSRITGRGPEFDKAMNEVRDRNAARMSQLTALGLPAASSVAGTASRYDSAAAASLEALSGAADSAATTARITAIVVSALTLLLLVAGVAAALVVARSLSRPIQRVRQGALDIADEYLPRDVADVLAGAKLHAMPSIPVSTDEEVGQLARAVESMYGRARELATAQAALRQQVSGMFETLSRRSNALLERQLSIVEKLESDEPDPKRLAELFELDHLAARMRRNGESLLVLAGAQSRNARKVELSVADAARAASAEVADYQRVVIADIGSQSVVASLSSDLIHLFAELLDNALSYSSPQSNVVVSGARTSDGGMLVEIVDSGLGIEPGELVDLNAVLRSTSELTADAARRMGLYVVGRLAAQHGIQVLLRANPSGGTIASIALPASALAAARPHSIAPAPTTAQLPVVPAEPAEEVRLAPVADITERASREPQSPKPDRPTLARRTRGRVAEPAQSGPAPSAPVSSGPAQGGFNDTVDPRTIRTRVTPASAEPGDEEEMDDRNARVGVSEVPVDSTGDLAPVPDDTDVVEVQRSTVRIGANGEPVYASTRSRWLTDTGSVALPWVDDDEELQRGRAAAARASRPVVSTRTTGGLPRRAPGAQLVPGGVSAPDQASRSLDPQVVRESMNRHLSGVRRGRAAARHLDLQSDSDS